MEALRRRLRSTGAPPLHKAELSRFTIPNRIFAAVYASAVVTLLCHHAVTLASLLLQSINIPLLFVSTALFLSDVVLAVMWITSQSFRMRPIHREEFPESISTLLKSKECEEEFPAIDVFVCTADPYKEPPMDVVNTALSVMAYDYPPGKVSVYVSDDGGSALTLFAFIEAAKFAAHWLPFCRENDVVDRCPEAYFASANLSSSSDFQKMKEYFHESKIFKINKDLLIFVSLSEELLISINHQSRQSSPIKSQIVWTTQYSAATECVISGRFEDQSRLSDPKV